MKAKLYIQLVLAFFLTTSLSAESLSLKQGWNLIGIASKMSASDLQSNSNIEKVVTGGRTSVTFIYDKAASFSLGEMTLGQGYWVYVNADTTLEYTKELTLPSTVSLKSGWNLVHLFEEMDSSEMSNYTEINKVVTGGVSSDTFIYDRSASFALGTMKLGQGYWINVDNDMEFVFNRFTFRAWDIGGDTQTSKSIFRLNGVDYTMFAYSSLNIEEQNANTSGGSTILRGTVMSKSVPIIQVNDDYTDKTVALKIFKSTSVFDDTTLITQSGSIVASTGVVDYPNITFENLDDFRPIEPSDTNIEMPPSAPVF